jgi:hypothetical protein
MAGRDACIVREAVLQIGCGPARNSSRKPIEACLPDEKSQVQNLAPHRGCWRKPRKYRDFCSDVLVCSRLFQARWTAKGPQRLVKGTTSDELRRSHRRFQALEYVGFSVCRCRLGWFRVSWPMAANRSTRADARRRWSARRRAAEPQKVESLAACGASERLGCVSRGTCRSSTLGTLASKLPSSWPPS